MLRWALRMGQERLVIPRREGQGRGPVCRQANAPRQILFLALVRCLCNITQGVSLCSNKGNPTIEVPRV